MRQLEEHFEDVDGVRMRWLERPGNDPTVVFVHGIPTSPELWHGVMARVDGSRLLAWEMVGYGRSWPAGEGRDISVRAQAAHLTAWLEHLGTGPAILVGHDLGAGVVQRVAVLHPERVAGIVLTDGIAYENWPIGPVKAIRALGPAFSHLPRLAFAAAYALGMRVLHDNPGRSRRFAGIHWRAGYDHPGGAATLVRQVRSLRSEDTADIAPELPQLRALPAAIAWGGGDRFLEVTDAERLARDLGADLDVIPGARHFTPEDHPDRVATAVSGVVARVAANLAGSDGGQ